MMHYSSNPVICSNESTGDYRHHCLFSLSFASGLPHSLQPQVISKEQCHALSSTRKSIEMKRKAGQKNYQWENLGHLLKITIWYHEIHVWIEINSRCLRPLRTLFSPKRKCYLTGVFISVGTKKSTFRVPSPEKQERHTCSNWNFFYVLVIS